MQSSNWTWVAVTALTAGLLAGGCSREPRHGATAAASPSPAAATPSPFVEGGTLSAESLTNSPDEYYGEEITLRGKVSGRRHRHAFSLKGAPGGRDVLVLAPEPPPVTTDDDVVVNGTVRPFNWSELSRAYPWFDLDPEVQREFEGQPMVVAHSVTTAEITASPRPAALPMPRVEAGALAQKPDEFYGKTVRVRANVEKVFGPRAFTLDEDRMLVGPDVLVLLSKDPIKPVTGNIDVTVTGTVRRFDWAQLKKEHPWLTLDRDLQRDLGSRPVLVAESVQTHQGVEILPQELPKGAGPARAQRGED